MSSLGRFPCTFVSVGVPTGIEIVVPVCTTLLFVIWVTVCPPAVLVVPGVGLTGPIILAFVFTLPVMAAEASILFPMLVVAFCVLTVLVAVL